MAYPMVLVQPSGPTCFHDSRWGYYYKSADLSSDAWPAPGASEVGDLATGHRPGGSR